MAAPSVEHERTGDADLVGIGVRLGTYLGAVASILSLGKGSPDDAKKSLTATLPLCLAILFTLTFQVAKRSTNDAAFIAATYLLNVTSLALTVSWQVIVNATADWVQLGWWWIVLVSLCIAFVLWSCTLALWFWWTGFRKLRVAGCETYVFFWAKVRAYGWFRILGIILGILQLLSVPCTMVLWVLGMLRVASSGGWIQVTFQLVSLAFMVLSTELTLWWNKLGGVNKVAGSTGQVIALILGAFNLLDTVFSALHDCYDQDADTKCLA